MKTTHLLIFLLSIFLISTSAFAQDDFYIEEQSEKTVSQANDSDTLEVSIFDEENYMSEEDYYETYYNDEYNSGEVYSPENERVIEGEQRKARNRRVAGEIVGEIIYNVVFSIAVILTW
ncbi:MAG: hypothetical protein VR77_09950 [Flavobacteriales bacterium BRH_c54]|nr:MAG: hypothetical protein VR77_09950 [Flavobacteriales bacterium BRH_c54]